MLKKMESRGLFDNPQNRSYMNKYFDNVLNDNSNITKTAPFKYIAKELPNKPTMSYIETTRESLLMGPNGGLLIQSTWDSNRLTGIMVKGK